MVIFGVFGVGKFIVFNILGGMDSNSEGEVLIDGKNIVNYIIRELICYCRYDVGFVF